MNRHTFIIAQVAGLIIALLVMMELIFSERGLNISAIYLSIAAFIISVISPKRGYLILMVLGCYLEVLKFGAWWQNSRYIDMISLNMPPIAAVVGISLGSLLLIITRKVVVSRQLILTWLGAIFIGGLIGGKSLLDEGDMGEAANASVYLMLIPVTLTLFKTKEECFKLLSRAVWVVLPAALYAIYQALFGYPEFHHDFVSDYRGWGTNIGDYIQPVGTMNSPISLGTTSALCLCFLVVRASMRPNRKFIDWILGVIFVAASILSGRRSSVLLMLIFFTGLFFFKTPWRTVFLYVGSFLTVLSLYVFATPLIYVMDSFNREVAMGMGRGSFLRRFTNTGTFTDRILGFKNMTTNPDLWSLFGSKVSGRMGKFGSLGEDAGSLKHEGVYEALDDEFVHDGLNRAIIAYGVIPLIVVGVIAVVLLVKLHRAQFAIRSQEYQKLIRVSVAVILGVGAITLTSQQALTVQPVNLFVFMWCGVFLVIYQSATEADYLTVKDREIKEA